MQYRLHPNLHHPASRARGLVRVAAAALALSLGATAWGQCHVIDFEDLPPGTVVTDAYPGVTFGVAPGSCGGGEPLPRIVDLGDAAASGSQALEIPFGCPDFGPDRLLIDFDVPQRAVSFTVGGSIAGPFEVTAVDSTSGIGIVVDFVALDAGAAPRSVVRLGDPDGPAEIRRVIVESTFEDKEIIDDLSFDADPTPPVAEIEDVPFRACVCDAIVVRGIACDPDGRYVGDRLEYRAVDASPGEPWTLYDDAVGEICSTGPLYTFDASGLPGGHYFLRLTVENECGLTSSDTATIFVDRAAPVVDVQRPAADGTLVCGTYDVAGQIRDHCGPTWEVVAKPDDGGPIVPLAAGSGDRCGVLATFDTTTVDEGTWTIRVTATDDCGQVTEIARTVVVNRAACALPDLDGDGMVGFSDLLILLTAWDDVMP